EVRRIGIDGTGEVNLTHSRAIDRYPAVSPNGRLVAFSSNRGGGGAHVWVMHIDGGGLRRGTLRKGRQSQPAWGPAGGRRAYVSGTPSGATSLWTVLANGKGDRRLTALQGDQQLEPAWSPNGHSLVYQECPSRGPQGCTLTVKPLTGRPVDISGLFP